MPSPLDRILAGPRRLGLVPRKEAPPVRPPVPGAGHTYQGIPRMPALFGRQGGPRQRVDLDQGYPNDVGSTTATFVAAQADANQLAALLPFGFAVAEPLLIVEAITLEGLPWLAGRGYEMLMITTPVVFDADGEEVRGRLELVTWENCPDAIISGREELGFNKVFADTMTRSVQPAEGESGKRIRYTASWGGFQFFELELTLDRTVPTLGSWRQGPIMHYRVIPRTGKWGELEVEQVTASTQKPSLGATRSLRSGRGSFRFTPGTFEQLPTLMHIVNKLAAISLGEVIDAGSARVANWGDLHDMRVLSSRRPKGPVGPQLIEPSALADAGATVDSAAAVTGAGS